MKDIIFEYNYTKQLPGGCFIPTLTTSSILWPIHLVSERSVGLFYMMGTKLGYVCLGCDILSILI